MKEEMTSMERIEAATRFEEPDRVPVSLFGGLFATHFVDMSTIEYGITGRAMAKALMAAHEAIGGDMLYCLSDMGFVVQGWGVEMKYPTERQDMHMALGKFAVKEPEDWEKLEVLDPRRDGRMHVYLNACRIMSKKYPNVPVGVSLPSPLTTATHVCSMDDVLVHMVTDPDALKKGLETITATISDLINACAGEGAYFTGYLTTRASKEITTEEQYREFGVPYDREVFKRTKGAIKHIPHICGVEPMFNIIAEYAAEFPDMIGISWWDRGAKPNLKEAKKEYGKKLCLMGGIDHTGTLITGTPEDVDREAKEAIEIAKEGSGFVLGPGCEVSPKTPIENLKAAIKAAEKYGKY